MKLSTGWLFALARTGQRAGTINFTHTTEGGSVPDEWLGRRGLEIRRVQNQVLL